MRLAKAIRALTALPPSRRRQWFTLNRARLITATLHALRLRRLGKRSIVQTPLFWTPEYVEIGDDVLIWPGCRIEGISEYLGISYSPNIVISDRASFQQNCHIVAASRLTVGCDSTISSGAFITDSDHEHSDIEKNVLCQPLVVRETYIGTSCFIGTGARILAGTRLGAHCIVGANAVVRGSFPDHCVIVGIPARIVKRFDTTSGTWRKTNSKGQFL